MLSPISAIIKSISFLVSSLVLDNQSIIASSAFWTHLPSSFTLPSASLILESIFLFILIYLILVLFTNFFLHSSGASNKFQISINSIDLSIFKACLQANALLIKSKL